MVEQPVLRYIPIEEDPEEPIRHIPTQAVGTAAIEQWFAKIPSQIKSYTIRYILNWYRAKIMAESDPQARFNLDEMKATGTGA